MIWRSTWSYFEKAHLSRLTSDEKCSDKSEINNATGDKLSCWIRIKTEN